MSAIRSTVQHVTLNTVWLLAGRVLTQGLSALTIILIARGLGAVGLGQYAFLTSIILLLNALTTFGTDTLIIREVARRSHDIQRWPAAATMIQLALSVVAIGFIMLVPGRPEQSILPLRLYSLALIPLAVSTVYSAILRGSERMDLYLIFNCTTAAMQLLGVLFVVTINGKLILVISALLGTQIIGAVVSALLVHSLNFHFDWRVDLTLIRHVATMGFPLVLLMGLGIVYQRIGIFALSTLANDAATGWFSAASRLIEGIKLFPYAVFGALFPILSRDGDTSQGVKSGQGIDGSYIMLIGFGLTAAILTTLFAPVLTPLLFGNDYQPTVLALQILVWSLIPYVVGAHTSLRLVAANRENTVLAAIGITVPIAIGLNIVLITWLNVIGAAWAAIASETIQTVLLLILARTGKPNDFSRSSR